MSEKVITNIENRLNLLIDILEIPYEIEDLTEFNKVYYSFDTERKRLKIIGNKHYKAFDDNKQKMIVKQKKVQIYLLKKYELDVMNANDLKEILKQVIEICEYVELLKMYKSIQNYKSLLEEKFSSISDGDIQTFMSDN